MITEQRLTYNLNTLGIGNVLSQLFAAEVIARGLSEFREYYVESEAPIVDIVAAIGEVQLARHFKDVRDDNMEKYYFDIHPGALAYVGHYSDYSYAISIATADAEEADALIARCQAVLPKIKHTDPDVVPVIFWAMTRTGVVSRTRKIGAPSWEDIIMNYTATARKGLDTVMNMTPPMDAGKLLLWHGEPGTGKSYGVRTLMREWRHWCRAHYIVDPERFFGEADYMLSVILDQTSDDEEDDNEPVCAGGDPKAIMEGDGRPWHLLVMEDADEFLQADAKVRQGQSLSRLLNMADGLIGQGLNLLVLITTNEPLGKIHPAIRREGRCMANIEFGKLSGGEALKWAEAHNITLDEPLGGSHILSDLYAKARGRCAQVKTKVDSRKMGLVR